MKVLVDTSIWSLALRKKKRISKSDNILVNELKELINEVRVSIIGPIRQEILSGITVENQFHTLKSQLKAFEDLPIYTINYETAAHFYNVCRTKGIQGSHIDFLICAVAYHNKMSIFSCDKDFELYSKHLKIVLYKPR